MNPRILLLSASEDDAALVAAHLQRSATGELHVVDDPARLDGEIAHDPAIVLCVCHDRIMAPQEVLPALRNRGLTEIPVIALYSSCEPAEVLELLRLGVSDFLSLYRLNLLPQAISRALENAARPEFAMGELASRELFAAHPQAMWIVDRATDRIVAVNAAAMTKYGYSRDEFLAMRDKDLRASGDVPILRARIERLPPASAGADLWVHRRKDGERFLVEISSRETEFRGRPALLIVAHRLADAELVAGAERETHLNTIAEHVNDVLYVYKPQLNRILYVSPAYEKIWGQPVDRLFADARAYLEAIHPDDRPRAEDARRRALEGEDSEVEFRLLFPGGTIRWIRDINHAVKRSDGFVERIVGIAREITDRKQASARLAEQAALLDQARDAIIVRDLDHRITYWNKSAERIYGWTAEEARGRSACTLLAPEEEKFRTAQQTLMANGEWSGELTKATKSGERILVDARWTLVRDDAGKPKSILAINSDITERRKLEQQFLRSQRMEGIGTLAGGIAHDLNNLLAPILMGSNLLQRASLAPEAAQVVETIAGAAKRGADLVRQVLSFARGLEGTRVAFNVRHVINEIAQMARDTFPRNITVESEAAADLWLVVADPTQMNQVVLNLAVNARDAMPNGGTLTIVARNAEIDEQYAAMQPGAKPGRYVCLEVVDTGRGIPRDIIDRIFEPFFTTKPPGRGTGLGLSTALGIVRSHAGFINVYSEPGRGTSFKIYLPATEGVDCSVAAENGTVPPRGKGEVVLIVDDEETIRAVTCQTLEAFGYKTLNAEDGAQAVALFAERRASIAAIITDIAMPVMDGPALIRAIRRLAPTLPVIAASGLGSPTDLALIRSDAHVRYLAKPYAADKLMSELHQMLNPQGQGR